MLRLSMNDLVEVQVDEVRFYMEPVLNETETQLLEILDFMSNKNKGKGKKEESETEYLKKVKSKVCPFLAKRIKRIESETHIDLPGCTEENNMIFLTAMLSIKILNGYTETYNLDDNDKKNL